MHVYDDGVDGLVRELMRMSQERLEMAAPLDTTRTPDELLAEAGQTITPEGIGGEAARLWEEVLGPACLSVDHPRYLSFIPGAPSKAAAAFDMLVGASSVYAGSWLEGSGIPGVVYSSCNPKSLAHDLARMPSYRIVTGRVLDMFPQTGHMEVAVLLERAA